VHGAYRAKDAARQVRRLRFIERLTSDVPVNPVSLDIARLAGRIEGQQEAKGIQVRSAIRLSALPRSISATRLRR
jgi:predicted nucleic acid-binding protein